MVSPCKGGDFNIKNSAPSDRPQKCEKQNLNALLDKDRAQIQQQLAKHLNAPQPGTSTNFQAARNSQERAKLAPQNLRESVIEKRKQTCEILLRYHGGSYF